MESLLTAEQSAWTRPGSPVAAAQAVAAADTVVAEAAADSSVEVVAEVAEDTEAVVTVDMVAAETVVTVVVAVAAAAVVIVAIAEEAAAATPAGVEATPQGEAVATAGTGTSLAAMVTGLGVRTEKAMTATTGEVPCFYYCGQNLLTSGPALAHCRPRLGPALHGSLPLSSQSEVSETPAPPSQQLLSFFVFF
ncbi:cold inducible RNA binding protein a isoform X4 [Sardina pilchardus]|uniref:cold inducible RNA binding protein a isoform X4 n=1 Tax=Sardina pilchardus TaxID=27697 RepID=UPI002E0F8C2D